MLSLGSPTHGRHWARYAVAAVLSTLALLASAQLEAFLGHAPFVFFYVAVALSALYCGLGPALLTSCVGILGVTYVLLRPVHSFGIDRPADVLSLVAFGIVAFAASSLTGSLRAARARAEGAVKLVGTQAVDLSRTNEALRRATADAERARVAADAARREAERANAAKSQFLAAMSHEIRTPINAVLGFGYLLADGIAGPLTDQQRDYVRRITASSQHLAMLVTDILDLAKIEANRIAVAAAPGRLAAVIADGIGLVQSLADAKRLRMTFEQSADTLRIGYTGDEDRVRQILVNLLSNAIKFTPSGGRIDVTCGIGRAPGAAYVRVADTGCGIAPDQLERIFDPFVQGTTTLAARAPGTGLGLAISRRLARLMHGDLTVESTPGAGSTFTLRLPACELPLPLPPPPPPPPPPPLSPSPATLPPASRAGRLGTPRAAEQPA